MKKKKRWVRGNGRRDVETRRRRSGEEDDSNRNGRNSARARVITSRVVHAIYKSRSAVSIVRVARVLAAPALSPSFF
jgi:hypothetical protein